MNTENCPDKTCNIVTQLAKLSGLHVDQDGDIGPNYNGSVDAGYRKFAEVIVYECIKLLDLEIGRLTEYGNSVDNDDYKADVDLCITKCLDNIMNIQEHFGVGNDLVSKQS